MAKGLPWLADPSTSAKPAPHPSIATPGAKPAPAAPADVGPTPNPKVQQSNVEPAHPSQRPEPGPDGRVTPNAYWDSHKR